MGMEYTWKSPRMLAADSKKEAREKTRKLNRGQGTSASQKRNDLRNRGIAASERYEQTAKDNVTSQANQAMDNQQAIKYGTARSLAAGNVYSGAGVGALTQAGLDSSMAGIRQASADEAVSRGLKLEAGKAGMASAEYAASAGSREEDHTAAVAAAETEIEAALTANSGVTGVNEGAVYSVIRAAIAKARLSSPSAATAIEAKWKEHGTGEGTRRVGSDWGGQVARLWST